MLKVEIQESFVNVLRSIHCRSWNTSVKLCDYLKFCYKRLKFNCMSLDCWTPTVISLVVSGLQISSSVNWRALECTYPHCIWTSLCYLYGSSFPDYCNKHCTEIEFYAWPVFLSAFDRKSKIPISSYRNVGFLIKLNFLLRVLRPPFGQYFVQS